MRFTSETTVDTMTIPMFENAARMYLSANGLHKDEDVVANVVSQAYMKTMEYDGRGSLAGFAMSNIRGYASNEVRKFRNNAVPQIPEEFETADKPTNIPEDIDMSAIAHLNERQQKIVTMLLDGMSFAEVRQALNLDERVMITAVYNIRKACA